MTEQTAGTAVVTGASSGIGLEYAEQLAKRGFDLFLVARRTDRLSELAARLQSRYGSRVTTVVADLSKAGEVQRVVDVVRTDPAITMVVNNAGNADGPPTDATPDQIDTLLRVNIDALVHLSLAALIRFKAKGGGTLINIGSVLGFAGYPGTSAYSATKAFVLSFTRGLQAEHADSTVKIQLVAPAGTATEGWDSSNVDSSIIMSAEDCVAASLKSLDMGEEVALPSVENLALLTSYIEASTTLMGSAQTGTPASRYRG